jgi:hypothetical protein
MIRTYANNSPNPDFHVGAIHELPLQRVLLRKSCPNDSQIYAENQKPFPSAQELLCPPAALMINL